MLRLFPLVLIVAFVACESSSRLLPANGGRDSAQVNMDIEVTATAPSDVPDNDTPDDIDTSDRDTPDDVDTSERDTLVDDTQDPSDVADVDPDLSDTNDADMMVGAGDCGPMRVLEDSSGEPVDALVEGSSWGVEGVFDASTPGVDITVQPNKCVTLADLEGVPTHGARYSMSTGQMVDCYADDPVSLHYQDSACTIPIVEVGPYVSLRRIGGQMKGAWGNAPTYNNLLTIYRAFGPGSCQAQALDDPTHYWAYQDLPANFPTQLPGAGPFSITVAR